MLKKSRKTTSVRKIVETLEKEIVEGHLKPNEHLVETEISRQFGVSRTPVREAMRVLESSGFVVFTPHRGWKVKEVSVSEVKEVYVIRANLASLVAELACHNLGEKELNILERIVKDMSLAVQSSNVAEYFNLNVKFHDIIEKAGGNGTLARIMESLDKITMRYRFLALSLPGRLIQSLDEHTKMVEAFKKKNQDEAAEAAKESALNAGKLLVDYFFKNYPTLSL